MIMISVGNVALGEPGTIYCSWWWQKYCSLLL